MEHPSPAEKLAQVAAASLADGTFVRLVLSSPRTGSGTGVSPVRLASHGRDARATVGDAPTKIMGRCVMLKGAPHLSLTLRYATRDATKNVPVANAASWLRAELGQNFRSALLCTTARDWQFISNEDGQARLIDHKPTSKKAPSREHDRQPAGLLDASARDWLQGLGVLDRDGKLRASMADKYRQINHYLEILSHLARECGWLDRPAHGLSNHLAPRPSEPDSGGGNLPANHEQAGSLPHYNSDPARTLHIADMGCGKGYLTFGTWHLLRRIGQQSVRVLGVETRADLVAATNRLAQQIQAEGLEFVGGTIESVKLPPVDALIALHACNTATDDAIRRGIELGAKLIMVAPCCHQEVRPQLGQPALLAAVLRHGVMAERMAEWATDGLRALFLEWAGYRTKIMEFVASEHTPKNLLIAAVREREAFTDESARQEIEELKVFFGIKHHALDPLLVAADFRRL